MLLLNRKCSRQTMDFIAVIIVVLTATAHTAVAEDPVGASIKPQGAVRREGDTVEFECRSPDGYTTLSYRKIEFVWEHDEQRTVVDVEDVVDVEVYTKINFAVVVSKQSAGTYKCYIYPTGGVKIVNVTVTAELHVVEAENTTVFVKKGSPYNLDCLESDNLDFTPEISWYVENKVLGTHSTDGPYSVHGKSLHIQNAGKKDAFTDIRCRVTSLEAFEAYGSVPAAFGNHSAAEIQKTLSVIEISKCERVPCQLQVLVYGHTAVDISWMSGSQVVNASFEITENFTMSKTEVLSSTEPVQLTITGGQNRWSEKIEIKPADDMSVVHWVVYALIGSGLLVVVVVVVILFVCRKRLRQCCKGTQPDEGTELNLTQQPLYETEPECQKANSEDET